MITQLLNFGYVSQMDPMAALHMGFLLGATGKKALDFGFQKYAERRQRKKSQ